MIGDLFPTVETPPWAERFKPTTEYGGKSACVVCGATGISPSPGDENRAYGRWWTTTHDDHVRCPCGKATTRRGMGRHRSAAAQHGHPCPPVEGAP